MTIREMRLGDLPTVLAIDRQSFSMPWSERSYRFELLENPAAHLLVAQDDEGTVVGYVGFWLIVDEAHISTLAVHPERRRQGIGERLLRAALTWAAALGADLATLEVRASNHAAQALYDKHGFLVVGRRKNYYRDDGEDALLMTLEGLQEWRWKSGGGVG